MKPLYIFDLDGTLALIDHRRHLVADKKNQRWDEFYRACVDDLPNKPVINIAVTLWRDNSDIKIFSGRSDIVELETKSWLEKYVKIFAYPLRYATSLSEAHYTMHRCLYLRPNGDSTPDQILKKKWYDELPKYDKERLVCVFDDRQKVVDMWRSIGVTCLQVAKGDF